MVNRLLSFLRSRSALAAAFARAAGRFNTRPSEPASFEMRFMTLQADGRFDEMWEMLAGDAQRAWGGREAFVEGMPRLGDDTQLLDMHVVSVNVLDAWTDHVHQREYLNVTEVLMRYRVRQQWREWTFDREVHLIPDANGWRTLCYPATSIASSSVGSR